MMRQYKTDSDGSIFRAGSRRGQRQRECGRNRQAAASGQRKSHEALAFVRDVLEQAARNGKARTVSSTLRRNELSRADALLDYTIERLGSHAKSPSGKKLKNFNIYRKKNVLF
jgi:hypothetical protein